MGMDEWPIMALESPCAAVKLEVLSIKQQTIDNYANPVS